MVGLLGLRRAFTKLYVLQKSRIQTSLWIRTMRKQLDFTASLSRWTEKDGW